MALWQKAPCSFSTQNICISLHTSSRFTYRKTWKTGKSNDHLVLLLPPKFALCSSISPKTLEAIDSICIMRWVARLNPHYYLAWLITSSIRLKPAGWGPGLSSVFLWLNVMACSWVTVYLTDLIELLTLCTKPSAAGDSPISEAKPAARLMFQTIRCKREKFLRSV